MYLINYPFDNAITIFCCRFTDPELSNRIGEMEKLLEENTNTVIGSTRVFLQGTDMYCRFGECNFGDLVTDAFVDYVSVNRNYLKNMHSLTRAVNL